jgi:G:T/U-mismatch repair DNA glycosylase
MKRQHNLKNTDIYIPNWDIEYLFIGTFNPENHIKVPYYYGREKNQTWKILSEIFRSKLNSNEKLDPNEEIFLTTIKRLKIACIDMIDSIEFDENLVNREDIDGNGYSDKAIINKKIKRNYNIVLINQLIKKNKNIKVFSTWGKGPKLKNWTQEVAKIETQIINLCSPSLADRIPKEQKLQDWKNKITI